MQHVAAAGRLSPPPSDRTAGPVGAPVAETRDAGAQRLRARRLLGPIMPPVAAPSDGSVPGVRAALQISTVYLSPSMCFV